MSDGSIGSGTIMTSSTHPFQPPVHSTQWIQEHTLVWKDFCDVMTQKLPNSINIENILRHGGLFINRERIFQSNKPKNIDTNTEVILYYYQTEPKPFELQKSDILFQDNTFIAINKPAMLSVQATRVSAFHTLESYLHRYFNDESIMAAHRLDLPTSGIIIFGKGKTNTSLLMKLWAQQQVHKTYLCAVMGTPTDNKFTVEGYLVPRFKNNQRTGFYLNPVKKKQAKWSQTHFSVIEKKENSTLLQAQPTTGRLHQIRIHCAHIQHPILGDYQYNPFQKKKSARLMLHAHQLSFIHPRTQQTINLTAPTPVDWHQDSI